MVLYKVYEQQKFMHDNKIHTIENRIVSISQPYIRSIVRGKSNAQVEFGAKLDLGIVDGFAGSTLTELQIGLGTFYEIITAYSGRFSTYADIRRHCLLYDE